MDTKRVPLKFAAHSKLVQDITTAHGWLPAARYTNLRDVRSYAKLGFLDIDWKDYAFEAHIGAAKKTRPHITIARDVENLNDLSDILAEADRLLEFSERVAIVPKDERFNQLRLADYIPQRFMLAYSVPSRYGGTSVRPEV